MQWEEGIKIQTLKSKGKFNLYTYCSGCAKIRESWFLCLQSLVATIINPPFSAAEVISLSFTYPVWGINKGRKYLGATLLQKNTKTKHYYTKRFKTGLAYQYLINHLQCKGNPPGGCSWHFWNRFWTVCQ